MARNVFLQNNMLSEQLNIVFLDITAWVTAKNVVYEVAMTFVPQNLNSSSLIQVDIFAKFPKVPLNFPEM